MTIAARLTQNGKLGTEEAERYKTRENKKPGKQATMGGICRLLVD
jgi:hypothetical protein